MAGIYEDLITLILVVFQFLLCVRHRKKIIMKYKEKNISYFMARIYED